MKRIILSTLVLALMVAVVGCGKPKKPDGLPDLQPVVLTVTQGTAPVANAVVILKATDSSATNNFTCGGTTDEKGVATIVTHGQYKGAPVGKYKVAVTCVVGEGTPPPPNPMDEESARVWKEYHDAGLKWEEFHTVNPELSNVNTTTLEIEVVKGKNNLAVDCGEPVHIPVDNGSGASGAIEL
ncbi:MAG: hypothetical protein Q4G03_10290 [Planctomycetia bacterium]|nr:hypothetical protein [Planctomycetia bacterium]